VLQGETDVQRLLETIRNGTALYGRLGDLLEAEREALTGHDPAGVRAANAEREALLEEIAVWEGEVTGLLNGLSPPAAVEGSLRTAVAALPDPYRAGAEVALAALKEAAETARHRAAVNHILLERNLDLVQRTLDIYTGQRTGVTYEPDGAKARGGSRGLVERKG
jgi:flagellar biosynthesis/type III secretory pathway chaperone